MIDCCLYSTVGHKSQGGRPGGRVRWTARGRGHDPDTARRPQNGAGADLSVVTTTPPIPNIALSAAPGLSAAKYARLQHALLGAPASLFQALGLPRFVIAHARQYRGQDRLLKIYWGY